MSIFLTQQVSYATKVEAFNNRGLTNQVSVRATDAGIYPISRSTLESRVRYAHLHDELPGRLSGKTQAYNVKAPVFVNILPKFDRFHYEAPTLVVEMKSGGEVLHAFGMFETGTSKMGLYAGKPTSEQMRQIMTMGIDPYESVPAGNVNGSGYCAYIQAWRGINAFFFMGGGDMSEKEPMKGGIARASVEIMSKHLEENLDHKGAFTNFGVMTPSNGLEKFYEPGSIRCITKPEDKKGFYGFVFPYFPEMLAADPDTPFQNFLKLYHHCIATSPEEMAGSVELLRRGFRYMAGTQAGRVIQHIYFGITLCIELGGFMHLISDGAEYAGFAIEGNNLQLLAKNRIKDSASPDDIERALELLSTHKEGIRNIYDALIEVSRADGAEELITCDQMATNPRILRKFIQARRAEDLNEYREMINENIGKLRYRQTYWEMTPKNIVRLLQCVIQRVQVDEEPMYVHIEVLMNRSSSVLEYLACFGAQAPSFYFGNTIRQIANTGNEDPNMKLINNKRALPHIPYVKKGLIAASSDWATVRRTHAIKFAGPKKAGANAPFSDAKARDGIIANPEFDEFYPLLRLWSYADIGGDVDKRGGGKRKKADEDVDMGEGTSSKKSKVSYSFL